MDNVLNKENIKLGDTVAVKIVNDYDESYKIVELTKEDGKYLIGKWDEFYFNKETLDFDYFLFNAEVDNVNLYDSDSSEVKMTNKKYKAMELIRYIQEDVHKIRINDNDIDDLIKDLETITNWF